MSAAMITANGNLSVKEARELLEHPVFGDERCVLAVRMLSMLEDSAALVDRSSLPARYPCPCCETTGTNYCDCCGSDADCHLCSGEGFISGAEVQDLDYEQIRRLHELAIREAARS